MMLDQDSFDRICNKLEAIYPSIVRDKRLKRISDTLKRGGLDTQADLAHEAIVVLLHKAKKGQVEGLISEKAILAFVRRTAYFLAKRELDKRQRRAALIHKIVEESVASS